MSVETTNLSAEAQARYDEAARLGLAASANLLVRELKKAFGNSYYKGGAFRDTLKIKASITSLTPYKDGTGQWETQVGPENGWVMTKKGWRSVPLAWEIGHDNFFTGQREHVPIFEPTGAAQSEAMRAAFARVVARIMEAK